MTSPGDREQVGPPLIDRARSRIEVGRPRLLEDHQILEAALHAFAAHGFVAMSLRSLNADLGLSHAAIGKRFSSKELLFEASVAFGVGRFFDDLVRRRATYPPVVDDVDDLRASIVCFVESTVRHPDLGRLLFLEGGQGESPSSALLRAAIQPAWSTVADQVERLVADGRIRPVTARALFYLVLYGAAGPMATPALSGDFDERDGPLDGERHATLVSELLMAGLGPVEEP